jgi:hypothetical protein
LQQAGAFIAGLLLAETEFRREIEVARRGRAYVRSISNREERVQLRLIYSVSNWRYGVILALRCG